MAPLTEPAFVRLRSVDPVLAEAAGDAAFELETDLFAALAKGIVEKGASDAFPFAWASLAAQIGEVSPERVLEAGSALEAFGKKTGNALLGAAKAVRSGKIGTSGNFSQEITESARSEKETDLSNGFHIEGWPLAKGTSLPTQQNEAVRTPWRSAVFQIGSPP